VRLKIGLLIICFNACTLLLCAGDCLHGQTSLSSHRSPAIVSQDSPNDLSLIVGKTVLVDCARPILRIAVGLGEVAEATAVSPTEIMLSGKKPGDTNLIVWDVDGGRQFFDVTVRANANFSKDAVEAMRRELRIELPGQEVKATFENNNVFLRGTVKDLTSAGRAVEIASTAGKVVNLLRVEVPAPDPQILLRVRFASVDRTKSKQLGINFYSTGLGNVLSTLSTGQFSPPSVNAGSGTTGSSASVSSDLNLFAFFPGLNVGATVQALQTQGVVEVLAEPNLLAANGKEASFLAGGEYPFPVPQANAGTTTITIMFKEYGVRLNFIPTITPRGTIRLQVAPEVSALDFSNSVQISGFDVPAITTRRVKTEVELSDGQSFVIGGLLDNRETETFEKLPFLGDIPVLGKLFQSMSKSRTNTELIVIVTPEIVAPIPAGAPLPALNYPAKFMPPNTDIPMHTPDGKTAVDPQISSPATMPVEMLIESMKPGASLVNAGASESSGAATPSTGNSPAPGPQ
jgi:pilus assembly protein CpaC